MASRKWVLVRHDHPRPPRQFPHRYWTRWGAERASVRLTRAIDRGYFAVVPADRKS